MFCVSPRKNETSRKRKNRSFVHGVDQRKISSRRTSRLNTEFKSESEEETSPLKLRCVSKKTVNSVRNLQVKVMTSSGTERLHHMLLKAGNWGLVTLSPGYSAFGFSASQPWRQHQALTVSAPWPLPCPTPLATCHRSSCERAARAPALAFPAREKFWSQNWSFSYKHLYTDETETKMKQQKDVKTTEIQKQWKDEVRTKINTVTWILKSQTEAGLSKIILKN